MAANDLQVVLRNATDNGTRTYFANQPSNSGNAFFIYEGANKTGYLTKIGSGLLMDGTGINIDSLNLPLSNAIITALATKAGTGDIPTGLVGLLRSGDNISALVNNAGFITGVDLSAYYLNSNPSGFITLFNLNNSGALLESEILAIKAGTGNFNSLFYPLTTNPSGYINNQSGASLQNQINNISNGTGLFYLNSNPSGFITSGVLGNYVTINQLNSSGAAIDAKFAGLSGQVAVINTTTGTFVTLNTLSNSGNSLQNQINILNGQTGSIGGQITALQNQTGNYATKAALTATGSSLQIQVDLLNLVSGSFYTKNNPSGFITSAALTPYATLSGLNATGNNLLNQINSLGSSLTGLSGSSVNSGVLTGYVTNLVLAASGSLLQTQMNNLSGAVGGISGAVTGNRVLQVAKLNSNANGDLFWAYPTPYASGVVPVIQVSLVNSSATDVYNHKIINVNNTGCQIKVLTSSLVTILGLSVLQAPIGAASLCHLYATSP